MTLTRAAHRIAIRGERLWDRLFPGKPAEKPVLEPCIGYATPTSLVMRGRVHSHIRRQEPRPDQSRWMNFRQMVRLFLTSEVAGVAVTTDDGHAGISDDEGYLRIEVPRPPNVEGWTAIEASTEHGTATAFPVLVPAKDADFGVISDVDDTITQTGAHRLLLNLWTTFTGSPLTREVFADSVALMTGLAENGRNPVYYVSSSPWNLHGFLETIFDRAGLPRGPLVLRDLGIAEDQFITRGHGHHKGDAIDTILAANPGLGFYLIGDTGQKDAFVYRDAARRHPGRVRGVFLREPGRGPDAATTGTLAEIADMGITVHSAPDFHAIAEDLAQR